MIDCICPPANDFEKGYNPFCAVHNSERIGLELSFNLFSNINMQRHLDWPRNGNGTKPVSAEWTLSDWGVAVAEEVGEMCGAIKRYNRITAGHIVLGKDRAEPLTHEEALKMLEKEIGDAITYMDLLAQESGTSLQNCVRSAFNSVSERQGLPHRI